MKKLILLTLLLCSICSACFAQNFTSKDGKVALSADAPWFQLSIGAEKGYTELLTLAMDRDTAVVVKKNNAKMPHNSFLDYNTQEKAAFRTNTLQTFQAQAKTKKLVVKTARTEVYGEKMIFDYTLLAQGKTIYVYETYVIHKGELYVSSINAPSANFKAAGQVLTTLKINNIPFAELAYY